MQQAEQQALEMLFRLMAEEVIAIIGVLSMTEFVTETAVQEEAD